MVKMINGTIGKMGQQSNSTTLAEHCEQVYDVDDCQDAKAPMNALRTSRGFYPVVVMLPSATGSPSGGKSRNKGSSKSKSKGKGKPSSKSSSSHGFWTSTMFEEWQCWTLGQDCPIPPRSDKKRKLGDELEGGVNMVESVDPPETTTLSTEAFHIDMEEDYSVGDDTAVQDQGAASVLGSACQIRKYLRFLLEQGYIHDIPVFHCEKGFKYGNSMKETTNRCMVLPVFLSNSRIDVLTYVTQGTARPMLERLGPHRLTFDRAKQMKWPDSEWEELPVGSRGEHLLHLGKDTDGFVATGC